MLKLPDRAGVESLADAYIREDALVAPSILDGYMSREDYIVCTWIDEFCNTNADGPPPQDPDRDPMLQAACEAAAVEFALPLETVQNIERRGRMIRARNIPGFEEQLINEVGAEEAVRIMGRNNASKEQESR